jgi:peptidoglycan/xylan/chitin deacetylase (PgdA/CDA1 family)
MRAILLSLCLLLFTSCVLAADDTPAGVPILVYHTFDPVKKGIMTISTHKFEAQMQWLKDNGYTFIPLQEAVDYLSGKRDSLPPKPVVITVDDGRETVYTYLMPVAKKFHMPVTLFIYPQVISHAAYALTWDQLKTLQNTGLFDVQDHTYWHPNFKQDKKHMTQSAYEKMVHVQLVTSKAVLEKKLGIHVTLLAWPFGIYDSYLENEAKKAGYVMAFSIDARHATREDRKMAEPRYMIIEGQTMKTFEAIMRGRMQPKKHH